VTAFEKCATIKRQEVAVSLLWHVSYDRDPAHMWLWQTVVEESRQGI